MFRVICLLCGFLGSGLALVSFQPLQEKPQHFKHIPGCYIEALGNVMPKGTVMQRPGYCMQYHCEEKHYVIETCPDPVLRPGDKLVEQDRSLPYPSCCPKLVMGRMTTHDEF
uniref:Venom peptide n=1 Tax=Comana monomorpha TaxID=1555636 RepID=A0AAU6PB23_9NEOP